MDRGKLSADRFINFDCNGIRWNVRVVVVDQLHHNTGPTNSISINDSERRPESTQQQWRHIYFQLWQILILQKGMERFCRVP